MLRRTKIVATLGPATDSVESLEAIIKAGVDVVRLNFSHGESEDHIQRANRVREVAGRLGRFVAVLADLQGPKIRIARFSCDKITLNAGDCFALDTRLGTNDGDQSAVGIDHEAVINDTRKGDVLLLDDGRIELLVKSNDGVRIECDVLIGGVLSNNKGINKKGGGLSAKALTDKDKADIKVAAQFDADYVAVSFPRDASDMNEARALLADAGSEAGLIAKIERAELVADNEMLDEVIRVSNGVMVARGDLAVEIGDAELVAIQKHIIQRARALNRVVITATQMMESMITSPMPTRAEVSDVANAVIDGTDAVMLSAETAVGEYPVEVIEAMNRICTGAERSPTTQVSQHRIHESFEKIDESIALSAMYAANHLKGVKAIVSMTETGATPLLMSRIRSKLPIFSFSGQLHTQRRMALYRGVQTIPFNAADVENEAVNRFAIDTLLEKKVVENGDLVILTKGDYVNAQGGTNTMKVLRVGGEIR
ncbi:pyruvate kinase [Alkalimarinus coralli]|uniref:pyruvate kinase n=1 Tax=Alkalimarinus coralli TaxID=2935863 RepID=UPI00202B7F14|nr:pyruvate kinase [Alkalimarinus coralli]